MIQPGTPAEYSMRVEVALFTMNPGGDNRLATVLVPGEHGLTLPYLDVDNSASIGVLAMNATRTVLKDSAHEPLIWSTETSKDKRRVAIGYAAVAPLAAITDTSDVEFVDIERLTSDTSPLGQLQREVVAAGIASFEDRVYLGPQTRDTIKTTLGRTTLPTLAGLLNETFTIGELRRAAEAVGALSGREAFDAGNFARMAPLLGIVPTDETQFATGGRPAKLWRAPTSS